METQPRRRGVSDGWASHLSRHHTPPYRRQGRRSCSGRCPAHSELLLQPRPSVRFSGGATAPVRCGSSAIHVLSRLALASSPLADARSFGPSAAEAALAVHGSVSAHLARNPAISDKCHTLTPR